MIHAVVLVQSERDALPELGARLADIPNVRMTYSVTGVWDFVALVDVKEPDSLVEVVTRAIRGTPGVSRTETMVAFEVFSQHDLEDVFSIGA